MCNDDSIQPKLVIQKILLYVKKTLLTPQYRQAVFNEISRSPQEIFFKKLRIVKKTFSAGLHELSLENCLGSGVLPTRLFTFLITESRSGGDLKKNPYVLKHFSTTSCYLNIGGYVFPNQPYVTDFTRYRSLIPRSAGSRDTLQASDYWTPSKFQIIKTLQVSDYKPRPTFRLLNPSKFQIINPVQLSDY